jgi:ribosomal protein L2
MINQKRRNLSRRMNHKRNRKRKSRTLILIKSLVQLKIHRLAYNPVKSVKLTLIMIQVQFKYLIQIRSLNQFKSVSKLLRSFNP